VSLAGLDEAALERKFAQAVALGEEMPRSEGQSLAKHILPSVVD
jgi:hypothetical protein